MKNYKILSILLLINSLFVMNVAAQTVEQEVTFFTLPDTARLDSISVHYRVTKGSISSINVDLKKIIIGGDLPDPRILNLGLVHIFDIALNAPVPPFSLTSGSDVTTTIAITNPVFDVLQPSEKITYKFTISFVLSSDSAVIEIDCITPNYTLLTFPTPPRDASRSIVLPKNDKKPRVHNLSRNPNDNITTTPIKHVVLIMLENKSFDNIFGTYPIAKNDPTEPGSVPFYPAPGTPIPDNLLTIDPLTGGNYLTTNRNVGQNGTGKVNPKRLGANQTLVNYEANSYPRIQIDVDNGLMDHFVLNQTTPAPIGTFDASYGQGANIFMDYWDGNSYFAFWPYAQNYAMNDHCFTTGYGESIVGAINWASGNTSSVVPEFPDLLVDVNFIRLLETLFSTSSNIQLPATGFVTWGSVLAQVNNVVLNNWIFPKTDLSILELTAEWFTAVPPSVRASIQFPPGLTVVQFFQQITSNQISPQQKNIGDLLNSKNITWGSFRGGFLPPPVCGLPTPPCPEPNQIVVPYFDLMPLSDYEELLTIIPALADGTLTGLSVHTSISPIKPQGSSLFIAQIVRTVPDFADPMPFDYYASTSNPHFNPPTAPIGESDSANHTYDLSEFFTALSSDYLPAVSYVRLPDYQDDHPEESNAYDSQIGVMNLLNAIMAHDDIWRETVVFIQMDECNGDYDHVPPPPVLSSAWNVNPTLDPADQIARRGAAAGIPQAQLRAGYGPRIPFLVISPYAKQNYVSHTVTDQTSVIRFIEDNWQLGRIGNGSYDVYAGSVLDMFDFSPARTLAPKVLIDPVTLQITIEPS